MISRYVCRYIRGESPIMAIVAKNTVKAPIHQKQFYTTPMITPYIQCCNNVLVAVQQKDYMGVFFEDIKDFKDLKDQSTFELLPMTTNDFVSLAKMMNMSAVVVLHVHKDYIEKEDNLYELYYYQKNSELK